MTAEQLQTLEFLLRNGGTYDLAPNAGSDVFDGIDAFLARFVAYPDQHARHAHVLWIAHCWFMDCWDTTPRLAFISPEPASGKTRALTLTRYLVPHPDHTADLTPAYLYHSIDAQKKLNGGRPTMLYDELDTVFGQGARYERMRRVIDAGHEKGGTVNRLMGKRGAVKFSVFAAMAMAGKMDIYDLPPTIRTRSVVVRMQRRAPGEEVERWNRRTGPPELEKLRDLLQFWAELVHDHAATSNFPVLPDMIQDRDADVWEPLIAVADLAAGHWPETARVAAVAAVAAVGNKAAPSRGMRLLGDIRAVFDKCGVSVMFTARLLTELRSLEESPWTGLTPMVMAKLLVGYGVEPKSLRIREQVARGYEKAAFAEAWRRYLPPQPATAATAATDGPSDE
jgi:hypothetical protein